MLHGISRAFRRFVGDVPVGRVLADGDELRAGGRTWRVRERPGHSPTDTVLAGDGVLLAGDHLLEKISSNPIAPRADRRPRPRGARAVAGPARARCSTYARRSVRLPPTIAASWSSPATATRSPAPPRWSRSGWRCTSGVRARSSTRSRAHVAPPTSAATSGATSRSRRRTSCCRRYSVISICSRSAARCGPRSTTASCCTRGRLVRQHWLKAIGHARGPLSETWLTDRPELLRRTGFPRRPRIATGDRLVYYASVWRRVFAVVEAVGEPEPREHPRVAVDDRGRAAARRPGARRRAAGRGDRGRGALDEPAVAYPDPAGALRARGACARLDRRLELRTCLICMTVSWSVAEPPD